MKIIAASDIHCDSVVLRALGDTAARERADLILLAGDICSNRQDADYCRNLPKLAKQAGCPVILTPGNHDFWNPVEEFSKEITGPTDVVCLVDESIEYCGIKIYGTPWTLRFGYWNWMKHERHLTFDIPVDTDILLCHSPPYGYGDETYDYRLIGSEALTEAIQKHASLKYVFFGHNHGDRGKRYTINNVELYNVACVDDDYQWPGDGFISVEI